MTRPQVESPSHFGQATPAQGTPSRTPRPFYGWIVVGALALILASTTGARFAFGAFLKPVAEGFGWPRADLSLAITIHLVVAGMLQPLTGAAIDRVGARLSGVVGAALLGIALVGMAQSTTLLGFYLWYGVLAALAVAICSTSLSAKLIGAWFLRRRATAHAIATSGIAIGQLVILPLATWVLLQTTWEMASIALGVLVLGLIAPIAWFFIRESPEAMGLGRDGDLSSQTERQGEATSQDVSLSEAVRTATYWQLSLGLLVCGVTMSFPSSHFLPFATDMGMSEMSASQALGVAGGLSFPFAMLIGYAADRRGRSTLLALAYLLRGLTYLVLVFTEGTPMLYLSAVVLGASWGVTVPLSAAIAADAFGQRHLGAIFGTMVMIMWVGAGVAAYAAGLVFDHSQTYQPVLWANLALGVLAALVVLTVRGVAVSPRRQVEGPATPL